ncbi:MAG TPA: hypothetical protein VE912_14085, partial [Bacteroidales bacterium]|nr:hypothetical protein [Bacteroidales bacterium]
VKEVEAVKDVEVIEVVKVVVAFSLPHRLVRTCCPYLVTPGTGVDMLSVPISNYTAIARVTLYGSIFYATQYNPASSRDYLSTCYNLTTIKLVYIFFYQVQEKNKKNPDDL